MTFDEKYGPWALVLGASEGLGAAWAFGCAARGLNVVVVARRGGLLDGVASEIADRHGVAVRTVVLDLAAPDLVEQLRADTDDLDVGLLVYNGAAGHVGPLREQSIDSLRSIVAVNCAGPLLTTAHFGTRMLDRGRGGIVIMGSAAGLAGAAYNSAYAASKAFDLVLGESLWAEWRESGVDVLSVIGPAIDTPNFRASVPPSANMPTPMAPEALVDEVFTMLGSTPSFVPGEEVRNGVAMLGTLPRQLQVEALSAAHASFADHPREV